MLSSVLNSVTFALLPFAAAVLGTTIAAFRPPRAIYRSFIQHLAAGVVFSVVAVELLPSIIHQRGALIEVFVGFALGVAAMFTVSPMLDVGLRWAWDNVGKTSPGMSRNDERSLVALANLHF